MITGVSAVAPSGDGAPVRVALSTAAASSASTDASPSASASSVAVAKPQSSSAGNSAQNADSGDRAATGQYLASLLAAQITGRAPTGERPAKITPERMASLISFLESSVASTSPAGADGEAAVDVTS